MTHLPDPLFVGDHPGADALNSCCAPQGDWLDWWESGEAFQQWLSQAGLLSLWPKTDGSSDAWAEVAAEARTLREAVRASLENGEGLPVDALNEAMSRLPMVDQIAQITDKPEVMTVPAAPFEPKQALAPVARALADLVCLSSPERTRQCDGPTCTLWFRDISRTNRRRWCSMAICGNRAKVAAHRARQRGD